MAAGGLQGERGSEVLAHLYRLGRSAKIEVQEYIARRELDICHAAQELLLLSVFLDRMVGEKFEMTNSDSVEVMCRRVYAFWKAFEDVQQIGDWKQPRGSSGKWKSKVKWGFLKEYDVKALEGSDWRIPEADKEVSERLQQRALFNLRLDQSGALEAPAGGGE